MKIVNKSAPGVPRRSTVSMAGSVVRYATLTALLAAGTAVAQQNASDTEERIEEVTVTGTMIRRDGYETSTPVSVLGEEALGKMPVTQIGEAVERLPVFQGSQNARNNVSVSDGTAGTNLLNLRGLGNNRTLVLLDGKRVVGAALGGGTDSRGMAVDISNFPTGLVQRVEVVTGGASAVYGSDAMAGVVNFILDKNYTGFKTSLQAGTTTHGDGETFLASFTGGLPFAGGRGHFLFDLEHGYDAGIEGKPRDWTEEPYALIRNPAYAADNTQPFYTTIEEAGLSVATRGGLIVGCSVPGGGACPLRGTQFQANGTPLPFEFGDIVSGVWMSGGDWQTSRIDRETGLALQQTRDNVFTRASYDVSDSTTVYGELLWGRSQSVNPGTALPFNLGNVTIHSGNPFIPPSVQAQMTAEGITSFTMGTVNGDAGNAMFTGEREMSRLVLGIEGEFDAAGSAWTWEASYVNNQSDILTTTPNNKITPYYNNAVDAVVNGAGQIVCRINADADPSNDDPDCVAYNNMGTGVLSPAAKEYAFGTGWAEILLEQQVVSASVSGEPFESWAGPVSLAFGAAHRTEEVSGASSELDQQAAFLGGNYNPSFGKYDVTEGNIETVIPLANDVAFAKQLDLNAAARWTDYSTSGQVTTWKVGASWRPTDDLRFRVTRSRDIRAPTLGNLFDAGSSGTGTVTDPFLNVETQMISQGRGNPDVKPEEGDTTGIGVVYQPSWLPEFSVSLDYYNIEVSQAILTVGSQEVLDRCFAGDAILCNSVIRGTDGLIDRILTQPQNLLAQNARGYDLEASYLFPLSSFNAEWEGDLSLRAMVTIVDKLDTIDQTTVVDGVGVTASSIGGPGFGLESSKVRYLTMLTYMNGPLDVTLTARGMDSGVYNNSYIECVPGSCPVATDANPTVNDNHIDAITYFDLGFNYEIGNGTVFFSAQNVLDTDPPRVATTSFWSGAGNMQFYERSGRILRAGINYEFK